MQWQLPTRPCQVQLIGINSDRGQMHSRKVKVELLSRNGPQTVAGIELIVAENWAMGPLPGHSVPRSIVPTSIVSKMADPEFHLPAMVHVLLGAGALADLVQGSVVNRLEEFAIQDSRLGYLLYGGALLHHDKPTGALLETKASNTDLTTVVERFWQLDEVPKEKIRSSEQEECERFFMKTHGRTPTGRYVVKMPLRSDIAELGSSKQVALRRFYALERRLEREPELRLAYVEGIRDMLRQGYLLEVNRPPSDWCYHIPHHAVLSKFRIVFDGSCKTDRGISINELQMKGEKLQDDLFALILKFRRHRIGITADVKKMYLQVAIAEEQWDLQRVFWREKTNSPIREYWLTRVTFGMSSAPHCAVRAMIQCARDHMEMNPKAAETIEKDFYMDDCLTGADSEEEAKMLCNGLQELLAMGGFKLQKWYSNITSILPTFTCSGPVEIPLGDSSDTTVLGLRWNSNEDELMFKFRPKGRIEQRYTKRDILAQTAEVFDPCGFVAPVMITPKIILRRLHQLKLEWDSPVPEIIRREWSEWQVQLSLLTTIRIPRWLGVAPVGNYILHGFADASESAYGAVIYIRLETPDGIKIRLVTAKSRVAPVKTVTIPRLELCAAVLLGKLLQCVRAFCRWEKLPAVMWTDSAIVLQWMKKDVDLLRPFVHNRIQSILSTTEGCEWRHVATAENPADCLSRGVAPKRLRHMALWWEGPAWLQDDCSRWPIDMPELTTQIKEEVTAETKSCWMDQLANQKQRPFQKCLVMTTRIQQALTKNSNLRRAIRQVAWIWRFIVNCQLKTGQRKFGDVTEAEEERALITLAKEEQHRYYKVEVEALQRRQQLPKSSPLWRLSPILDGNGLLKLRGRLQNSLCAEGQMHPIILPDVSHLAQLLIRHAHRETFHGGYQLMAAALRQKFWILRLRRAVRTYISRCLPCVRQKQKVMEQIMGNLPADRVRQSPAFQHSGVDFAGPFEVKARGGRCKIFEKKYVAVFVCLATKAVHLELVENLSTAAFISAFLRFTGLRGSCTQLFSDNGTNFTGAERELGRMVNSWAKTDSEEFRQLRELKVKWHFITPSAPHQGGLWEAAVKSMKHHLRRVIGQHALEGDHFRTLLAQISAILNSRPLSALSEDPTDLEFLCPGHFVIGRPMKQLFGERVDEPPRSALKRYELTQHMSQSFWKQWHTSYLNELQQRAKWTQQKTNVNVGDLVLIKEDNVAPTFWKTGRVSKIMPGSDGLVRNVELTVAEKKRRLLRPVQKLVFLPLDRIEEIGSSRGDCVSMAGQARAGWHLHTSSCGDERRWCEERREYVC